MYKGRVEKLHKQGIITDEEYNSLMEIGFDKDGYIKPGVPKCGNDFDVRYNLGFKPYQINLIEAVKASSPWLGAECTFPSLFGKYGFTYGGICDGWQWLTKDNIAPNAAKHGKKPLEMASELELWQMLAISNMYYNNCHSEWCDKAEKKAHDWELYCHKIQGDFDGFNLSQEVLDKIQEPT